jgi:hypothetical protein
MLLNITVDIFKGHFQSVLKRIGWFCISLILIWVLLELLIGFLVWHRPCTSLTNCAILGNTLVLIVGGIPIGTYGVFPQ